MLGGAADGAEALVERDFSALVERVDALCRFEVMKEQAGGAAHMRQGKAGNWRQHFTPILAAHFDAATAEEAQLFSFR